uniref:Uncharacterized protein n=1 Tax=Panagrellus redivivus TaxID=6233 RepID=A0A7E4VTS2_PANRE
MPATTPVDPPPEGVGLVCVYHRFVWLVYLSLFSHQLYDDYAFSRSEPQDVSFRRHAIDYEDDSNASGTLSLKPQHRNLIGRNSIISRGARITHPHSTNNTATACPSLISSYITSATRAASPRRRR